jgi:hypothetical protein
MPKINVNKPLRVQVKYTVEIPPEKLRTLRASGLKYHCDIKRWLRNGGQDRLDVTQWMTEEEFEYAMSKELKQGELL